VANLEINGNLRLKISTNPGYIADLVFRGGVQKIFEDELLETAAQLERESPVGATGQLKSSWRVTIPRREPTGFAIAGSIYNDAPNAINRIAGRSPGLFPPIQPIFEWTLFKIESDPKQARRIAFLIARGIAQKGTQRWRKQENIAGIDRQGRLREDSPIRKAEERIARRISQLGRI
jgi:hypothetical protein